MDWRRRVGDLYRLADREGVDEFRLRRDELFATHPMSPIPVDSRDAFTGLDYFPYNPGYRFECVVKPWHGDDASLDIDTGGEDGVISYERVGVVEFTLQGRECRLTVLALKGYGKGLFVAFRDATAGGETYGGGRYLFDTIKNTDGAVLEVMPGSSTVTVDFNYAYNPSCAYDSRWACPLAPRENWLDVEVRAGEKLYSRHG